MAKPWIPLLIIGFFTTSLGCGSTERVTTHPITGTVTHGGDTVPSGTLRFTPDAEKGNRGPATTITIADGKYHSLRDYGVIGGPYIVEITAFETLTDEQAKAFVTPKPLFKPYTVAVDLEARENVKNFDVPKDVPKK